MAHLAAALSSGHRSPVHAEVCAAAARRATKFLGPSGKAGAPRAEGPSPRTSRSASRRSCRPARRTRALQISRGASPRPRGR